MRRLFNKLRYSTKLSSILYPPKILFIKTFSHLHEVKHVWIFYYAVFLHLTLGYLFIIDKFTSTITAFQLLEEFFGNAYVLGWFLIIASIMSILSMVITKNRRIFGFLILPQQCALIASAIGSIYQVWIKRYQVSDLNTFFHDLGFTHEQIVTLVRIFGPVLYRITDHKVLLASQIPTILAAVMHLGAVVSHSRSLGDG